MYSQKKERFFMNSIKKAVCFICIFLVPFSLKGDETQTYTFTVQAAWPSGNILYENLTMFAQSVEKMSNGRIKIKTHPADAIVPVSELIDAVSKKVIDGAHTAPGYNMGRDRTAIPLSHGNLFGMDGEDIFGWYYYGGGLTLLDEWYQQKIQANVVAFPIGNAGNQPFGWMKKPIKNWDDLKGVKFRTYGINSDVLNKAGMAIVNIPGGEVAAAGDRGLIDGCEFAGAKTDIQLGFQKIWKNYYAKGVSERVSVIVIVFNKETLDKLPDDLKAIIKAATIETYALWNQYFKKENARSMQEIVQKHAVTVFDLPADIKLKQIEISEEIEKNDADKNPFYKKVLDSQKAYAQELVPYRLSNEISYDTLGDYYWKDKVYIKRPTETGTK